MDGGVPLLLSHFGTAMAAVPAVKEIAYPSVSLCDLHETMNP